MTPSRIVSITQTTRSSATTIALKSRKRPRVVGLVVALREHAAAPEHVVDDDQAARLEPLERGLVVPRVAGLVGVDEDEVVRAGQPLERALGRADVDRDPVGPVGPVDPAGGELGVLRLELQRVDRPVRRERAGHRDRRVPGVRADLEDAPRACEEDEELEQPPLELAREHLGGRQRRTSLGGELVQELARRRRVRRRVGLDLLRDDERHGSSLRLCRPGRPYGSTPYASVNASCA